ncbi:MAG TPA: peptidase M23 [Thiotrichales bacterium]|nr:peptidase M23 [Thiotrichales bacterium]
MAEKNDDMVQYQQKLEKLQKSIAKVQQHLKGSRKKRGNVITELHKLEQEISKNTKKINILSKKVLSLKSRRKKLEKELAQLNRQLQDQKQLLTEQIRSAYRMGQQQQIKMLLNQQSPAETGRMQTYFIYLNRVREQQILAFQQTIVQKRHIEADLRATLEEQGRALAKHRDRKKLRQKQRLQRKKLVAQLNNKIKNQEKTLSNLESSRGRIENLLKSLGELLADIPAGPADSKPFKSQKGKLPWPLKGPFLAQYGRSKNQGDLKWNGVLIGADYGTPVRAISHGRVAFADWLQGFGFITIIDHGDGYMSLYGHNESLFKQVGDWVQAGEVIATAGDSGGQTRSALYFEIRSRGKPVNPTSWCSTNVKHVANQ